MSPMADRVRCHCGHSYWSHEPGRFIARQFRQPCERIGCRCEHYAPKVVEKPRA